MDARIEARHVVGELVAAYNRKDASALESLYAEEVSLWSTLGEDTKGKESVLAHIHHLFDRLPDEKMSVDTLVTDGETVILEVTSTGTSGGAPYTLVFTEVLEVRNGQIVSVKTYVDPDDVAVVEAK